MDAPTETRILLPPGVLNHHVHPSFGFVMGNPFAIACAVGLHILASSELKYFLASDTLKRNTLSLVEEHGSVLKDLKDKQKEVEAKPPTKEVAEKATKSKGGEAL